MADVFVSYSRADSERVASLVGALEAHRLSVWWDRSLEQDARFASIIRHEITSAAVVLVCWSTAAAESQWVQEEANEADHLKKYLGCLIATGRPALPFGTRNNVNLLMWSGEADDIEFLKLLKLIGERTSREEIASLADVRIKALNDEQMKETQRKQAEALRIQQDRQRIAAAEAERRTKEALLQKEAEQARREVTAREEAARREIALEAAKREEARSLAIRICGELVWLGLLVFIVWGLVTSGLETTYPSGRRGIHIQAALGWLVIFALLGGLWFGLPAKPLVRTAIVVGFLGGLFLLMVLLGVVAL